MIRTPIFFLLFILSTLRLAAHEGMWIPALLNSLNSDHLHASGLRLSAEDIYSLNQSSLKDAIVHFGGGCTAEVISDQGLILTNYHCGYGEIQSHSSVEKDYLSQGFWAKKMSEELMNPGLTATFIVRIEDVTSQVMSGLNDDMPTNDRNKILFENSKRLEAEYSVEGLNASVRAFFYGNEYYMIISKVYKDVRLVGAPPSSIGKFGGDTDNWIWPRHTGDFSLFRIYADSDGEPAEPDAANKPYKPLKSLKINISGVKEGDFTMVYGFPGRTEQYLTSDAVDHVMNTANPLFIHMRETSLGIIDAAMASDDGLRIKYAAKQASISNAYKKWIGQNFGLNSYKALDKKKAFEAEFKAWANEDPERRKNYGGLLGDLKEANQFTQPYSLARNMFIDYVYYGPEIIRFANRFDELTENYEKLKESGELDALILELEGRVTAHFKDYDLNTDKKVFNALTKIYLAELPKVVQPDFFRTTYDSKYKGSITYLSDKMYGGSIFSTEEETLDFLRGFNEKSMKALEKDPAWLMMKSIYRNYRNDIAPNFSQGSNRIDQLMAVYVKAQQEMEPEKLFWPDANSTLRLTYGKLEGSKPRDGVEYLPFTTLEGVIDKYVPGHADFDLPARLIELYDKKDYGQYANAEGKVPVCFTGSNHTTGGNSGSPALDADGQLIGLNFDRSWESTMSDIMFDPDLCRNIMVDIRYVLFIIDKYAGATNLIQEMDLVTKKVQASVEQ